MSAELERMLANVVRVGRVKEVDHANALVKLEIGGLTTDWLSWGVGRAGTTRTWSAPTVGEQRLLLSPYGDMTQAIVGQAIYQDDHAAPATSGDQEHVVFPDGSTVDYNSATNTLTVTVSGSGNVVINCKHATVNAEDDTTVNTKAATINAENTATVNTKTATVNAETKVELATPLTHCTGALTVDGLLTYKGGMSGSGGSGASLTGNFAASGGTFTHNSKNVGSTHTHTLVQPGSGNSGPPP